MKVDLDIIIPCFNAKDTLFYTLSSISIQKGVFGFNVYLINDKSDYDYDEEVEFFSHFFNIEEIKLDKNLGPGGARHEGILKTNSKYIMFIDSDDILYDCFSIRDLYKDTIGHDLGISNFILERDNVRAIKKENFIWLHGKMYNRDFLDKHNINFNDTRANEDNGFNRLILLLKPDISYINKITYVYKENKNSITRKNNRSYKIFGLEGFIYNMKWAIDEALKRGADKEVIPYLVSNVLISMYYDYLYNIDDENVDNIIKYSKDILEYYTEIPKNIQIEFFNSKEKAMKEENKEVEIIISFEDFIKKVQEYD